MLVIDFLMLVICEVVRCKVLLRKKKLVIFIVGCEGFVVVKKYCYM